MTLDQIQRARDVMQTEELKDRRDKIVAIYDCSIKIRAVFDRDLANHEWDEDAAADRVASLVFGDGTNGSDDAAIGLEP